MANQEQQLSHASYIANLELNVEMQEKHYRKNPTQAAQMDLLAQMKRLAQHYVTAGQPEKQQQILDRMKVLPSPAAPSAETSNGAAPASPTNS